MKKVFVSFSANAVECAPKGKSVCWGISKVKLQAGSITVGGHGKEIISKALLRSDVSIKVLKPSSPLSDLKPRLNWDSHPSKSLQFLDCP